MGLSSVAWSVLRSLLLVATVATYFLAHADEGLPTAPEPAVKTKREQALEMINSTYNPRIKVEKLTTEDHATCKVEWIRVTGEDPVDHKPRGIRIHSYSGSKPSRAVIIVPSIVGTSQLETGYAEAICEKGYRAVVIETIQRDTPIELDIASYDRTALRKLAAIRQVAEYLSTSSKRIGILGTSAGALSASLALAFEPKIKSAVLIAAGADLAQIVVDSTETSQARLREERMNKFGYRTRGEYLRALKSKIVINNADFIGLTGKKEVLMSIVTDDTVIPTRTQLALRKLLQPRAVIENDGDHIGGIIKTFMNERERVVSFFGSTLF